MPRRIYLVDDNGTLSGLEQTAFESEALLQQLIAKYPDLLAGDQMDTGGTERRWLLVTREMGVPGELDGANRWSLDHLFLDNEGIPTLVEVKRSRDSRIRREVVGQMLDYAANGVVHWPVEEIKQRFERRCEDEGSNPEEQLVALLGDSRSAADFWLTVKTNLSAGRIRLVFIADQIPPELARVVEFLNDQMALTEVLAVEVSQFVGKGVKTLVPRLLGQTETARLRKGAEDNARVSATEAEFMQSFEDMDGGALRSAVRRILSRARELGFTDGFTKGVRRLAYLPALHVGGTAYYPLSVSRERVVFQGRFLAGRRPFDSQEALAELSNALQRVPGVQFKDAGVTGYPGIPWSSLVEPRHMDAFLEFLGWLTGRLRSTSSA